jgi:hypothetical protein
MSSRNPKKIPDISEAASAIEGLRGTTSGSTGKTGHEQKTCSGTAQGRSKRHHSGKIL